MFASTNNRWSFNGKIRLFSQSGEWRSKKGYLYPVILEMSWDPGWSLPTWEIPIYPRYVSWKNGIHRKSPSIYRYCPPVTQKKRYPTSSGSFIKVARIPRLFLGNFSRPPKYEQICPLLSLPCLIVWRLTWVRNLEGVNIPEILPLILKPATVHFPIFSYCEKLWNFSVATFIFLQNSMILRFLLLLDKGWTLREAWTMQQRSCLRSLHGRAW